MACITPDEKDMQKKLIELSMEFERKARNLLASSSMNKARKGFYEWHVRDGLRLALATKK
jgi:hypothetical protein